MFRLTATNYSNANTQVHYSVGLFCWSLLGLAFSAIPHYKSYKFQVGVEKGEGGKRMPRKVSVEIGTYTSLTPRA